MIIFRSPYLNTLYIWVVIFILFMFKGNFFTALGVLVYTGYLPVFNGVLWLSKSRTGKVIRERLKVWHWAVITSWVVFIYSLYAQSWASSLLNDIFKVGSSHFPITESFLAVLIAPVSLLYYPDYLAGIHTATIISAMIVIPALSVAFAAGFSFRVLFKIFASLLAIIALMTFFVTLMFNFTSNLNDVTKTFALNADFYSDNPCNNEWASKSNHVIFLGGDRVLAYFENSSEDHRFKVVSCDYTKRF